MARWRWYHVEENEISEWGDAMLLLVRGADQGQPQLGELADTCGQVSSIHKDLKIQLWIRRCLETTMFSATEQNTGMWGGQSSLLPESPVPEEKWWHLCLVPFLRFPSFLPSYPILWRPHACQAPLSMEFFRQGYQSGLPFPSPGDLPN